MPYKRGTLAMWQNIKYYAIAYAIVVAGVLASNPISIAGNLVSGDSPAEQVGGQYVRNHRWKCDYGGRID